MFIALLRQADTAAAQRAAAACRRRRHRCTCFRPTHSPLALLPSPLNGRPSIALVCRQWHRVLYEQPALWDKLAIDVPPAAKLTVEQAAAWLAGKEALLRRVAPLLAALAVGGEPLSSLAAKAGRSSNSGVEALLAALPLAAVERLSITQRRGGGTSPQEPSTVFTPATAEAIAALPRLCDLTVGYSRATGHAVKALTALTCLTHLTLHSTGPVPGVHHLTSLSGLQELELCDGRAGAAAEHSVPLLPAAAFPALRRLAQAAYTLRVRAGTWPGGAKPLCSEPGLRSWTQPAGLPCASTPCPADTRRCGLRGVRAAQPQMPGVRAAAALASRLDGLAADRRPRRTDCGCTAGSAGGCSWRRPRSRGPPAAGSMCVSQRRSLAGGMRCPCAPRPHPPAAVAHGRRRRCCPGAAGGTAGAARGQPDSPAAAWRPARGAVPAQRAAHAAGQRLRPGGAAARAIPAG